jgi:hypothetical protein
LPKKAVKIQAVSHPSSVLSHGARGRKRTRRAVRKQNVVSLPTV